MLENNNVVILTIQLNQKDCPFSKLSNMGDIIIKVNKSTVTNINKKLTIETTFVTLQNFGNIPYNKIINKFIKEVHKNSFFYRTDVKITKRLDNKMDLLISNFSATEMMKFYSGNFLKCIRIFPTIISGNRERWAFICENKDFAEVLLSQVSKLKNTNILDYNIQDIFLDVSAYKIYTIIDSFEKLKTSLTKGVKEILFMAYQQGYYNSNKKVRLKELSLNLGKSKSLISQQLRRGENKVVSTFMKLLEVENGK